MFSFLHEKKTPPTHGVLFTLDALEKAYLWICNLRKDYSHNADIWNVGRDWHTLKHAMFKQLNDGSYVFSLLDRYVFDDATITLWSSLDMIALKLITFTLSTLMG